jgi:uncharacterized repeat protein (TIGR03803 family)
MGHMQPAVLTPPDIRQRIMQSFLCPPKVLFRHGHKAQRRGPVHKNTRVSKSPSRYLAEETMKSMSILFLVLACSLTLAAAAKNTVKTLLTFDNTESLGNLIFDSAGNLYGTTGDQYNEPLVTVFQLSPNGDGTWTENVLWMFTGGTQPNNIFSGVIFDASGNLYGTSRLGGAYGCGTVFELTHESSGSWPETNLFDFNCGSTGNQAVGGLVFDSAGNLYGTTSLGGTTGNGVVYELTPNPAGGQWTETILHNFKTRTDGGWPGHENLIIDSKGALYGTASQGAKGTCAGGYKGCGTVFQLTPKNGSWTYKVLHSFTGGSDGGVPEATLIFDKAGNLYGTTYLGGTYGFGVVFELIPHSDGSWSEKVLHEFSDAPGDGNNPFGGVIFDSAGNLYGTTAYGGDEQCVNEPYTCGIVYELTPKSNGSYTENILVRFQGAPNATPYNDLVMDSLGNLYGVATGFGMDTSGSVYEVIR